MPVLAGPLPLVVLSRLLALAVLAPLVAVALSFLFARATGERRARVLAWCAYVPAGILLVTTLLGLVELGSLPPGYKQLFGGAVLLTRIGSYDASIGLALDGLSGPPLALVAALLLAAQAATVRAGSRAGVIAATNGLVTGASLALVADGTTGLTLGLAITSISIVALVGQVDATSWARLSLPGALAVAAIALSAGALFWGSAGSFTREGFVPDARVRFSSVDAGSKVLPRGLRGDDDDDDDRQPNKRPKGQQGTISLLSAPGARLFVDNQAAPFATAPFVRKPISAGGHSARLVLGDGADDVDLVGFKVLAGADTTLSLFVPATSFRDLALLVRARDLEGPLGVGSRLRAPVPGGSVLSWVLALAAVAGLFLTMAGAAARDPEPGRRAAILASAAVVSAYVVGRLAGTLGGEAVAPAVIGAVLSLAGLVAWRTADPEDAVPWTVAAHAGAGIAIASAGSPAVGVFHTMTAAAAGAVVLWGLAAARDRSDSRAPMLIRAGAMALGVVPPGAGVTWTALEGLRTTGGEASVAVAVALLLSFVGAAACWRAIPPDASAAPPEPPKNRKKKGVVVEEPPSPQALARVVATGLAPIAAVLGLLGSTSIIEGPMVRLARSAIPGDPGGSAPAGTVAVLAVGLAVLAALAWSRRSLPHGTMGPFDPTTLLARAGEAANALEAAVSRLLPGGRVR
jgi:hypothetical protein